MNNIKYFFILTLIWLVGCKEEPPFINYNENTALMDSSFMGPVPQPQQKAVLIEDVSGVRCVNCPDATKIAKDILKAFPGRSYATVLHPNLDALRTFVEPITKEGYVSKYDFRTDDAAIILEERLGLPNSLPLGAINRRLFSGKTSRLIGRQEWYSRCEQELQGGTPVNIDLKNDLNESTGEGVITVTLTYTQTISEKNFLSMYLVEDSIIDSQIYTDPVTFEAKYIKDYLHMFILRDVITSPTGDLVSDLPSLTPGRTVIKQYPYKLNVSSKINVTAKNARILAFVSKDSPGIDILHVNGIKIKN